MAKWVCNICQYTLEADNPPEKCPSCNNTCSFIDATCYTPECGCGTNINQDLYKKD